MSRGGDLLTGLAGGTLSGLDEQKKQKQALLLELLKSGAYQPSANQQQLQGGFLSRVGQNITGPNLSSPNTDLMGLILEKTPPQTPPVGMEPYSQTIKTPKGITTYRAPQNSGGSANAKDIVQGMIDGKIPPDPSQITSWKDRSAIAAEAQRRGFDLKSAMQNWQGDKAYSKNINSTQQVRMGQAMGSVKQGLDALGGLNAKFKRSGWTPLNGLELKAALTGTDPTKRDIATEYMTQINLLKDEMAQVFMAGGQPSDKALGLTDVILNPLYGKTQLDQAIQQVQRNITMRERSINSMQPRRVQKPGQQPAQDQNGQSADQGGGMSDDDAYTQYLQAVGGK